MRCLMIFTMLCASLIAASEDMDSSKAEDAFKKSDWPQVVALYTEKTKASPNDAQAWYRMGRGLEETKRYSEAQDAFTHAAQLKFPAPTIWAHVAANAAAAGHREDALKTLESMAASGFPYPKVVLTDARFAAIKDEPRYRAADLSPAIVDVTSSSLGKLKFVPRHVIPDPPRSHAE